jgi:hypothetical protein
LDGLDPLIHTTATMNKLMLMFVAIDFLFLACGGLLLGFSLLGEQQDRATPTVGNVAYNILLTICPLTGMIQLLKVSGGSSTK